MKYLYFIIIFLAATLYCNAQEDEVFTTIYTTYKFKNRIYVSESDDFDGAKFLKEFERDITSLIIYNNHLFVSIKRSHKYWKDSKVWRANIADLKNFELNPQSWEEFHVMNNFFDDITCMTVAEGYIYVGMSDESVSRCSAETKNSCESFKQFGVDSWFSLITGIYYFGPITGIDYNPVDRKIYILREKSLHICSTDIHEGCQPAGIPRKAEISALKVAFNAVWFGVKRFDQDNTSFWLVKCPIEKEIQRDCKIFENHPDYNSLVHSISNTNRYLYFNFWNAEKIWRCDPNNSTSCLDSILKPRDMNIFIIVP